MNKNQRAKNEIIDTGDYRAVIGKNRPFATAEAHKRLRANIMFSLLDEGVGHVIGVTSAMAHEGKTTTSINLAFDMAQVGKRVLLIDADMRMSNIAKVVGAQKAPGLSDILVGNQESSRFIQKPQLLERVAVVTCGTTPPNPSELLASKRMEAFVDIMKKNYDYVIIDLPPIAAVSDALIVSQYTDGIVLVVRQDYADKRLVDDAVRQLQYNEANLLGFVVNCSYNENKYYGKYGKYGKYGRYARYGNASQDETGAER